MWVRSADELLEALAAGRPVEAVELYALALVELRGPHVREALAVLAADDEHVLARALDLCARARRPASQERAS